MDVKRQLGVNRFDELVAVVTALVQGTDRHQLPGPAAALAQWITSEVVPVTNAAIKALAAAVRGTDVETTHSPPTSAIHAMTHVADAFAFIAGEAAESEGLRKTVLNVLRPLVQSWGYYVQYDGLAPYVALVRATAACLRALVDVQAFQVCTRPLPPSAPPPTTRER